MCLVASFKEDTPFKSGCKCQGFFKIPLFNFRFISKEAVDYVAHPSTHTPNGKIFGECVEVALKVSEGVQNESWDRGRTYAGSRKALCRE